MINPSDFTVAIIAMAVITFSVRYVFFINTVTFKLHPQLKNLLIFTAPCILTTMFIPIMFQDMFHGLKHTDADVIQMFASLLNSSYFWACCITILLSLYIRQTLLVIILGMLAFYVLRLF